MPAKRRMLAVAGLGRTEGRGPEEMVVVDLCLDLDGGRPVRPREGRVASVADDETPSVDLRARP